MFKSNNNNLNNQGKWGKVLISFLTLGLYDTYFNILLGKVVPDQMSSVINNFFNNGDDTHNNYCYEQDYHRGDFVIKFPNPDHPTYKA